MITYEALRRNPAAFRSLTGQSPDQFDALFADFAPAHRQRCQALTTTKKEGQPRQRPVGGGPRHRHDLQTRLLIALFWLRVYPTFEVLGFFFSLNKTNVHEAVHDMLATLAALAQFPFERPPAQRKKLRSAAAVMEAFPDVRLVIDAKEQRIQRPKSSKEEDRQRPYYSGKKKCHTLKNQVAVEPDGRIGAVSLSVPGGGIHDLVLLRMTHLVERLTPGEEAAMVDKGYEGLGKDYPQHTIYQPIKARKGRPLTEEEKAYNRKVSQYRIVVEHTNAQLNQYQVLSQVYRHGLRGHSRVVRAVAYWVDRRIEQRPLKSYSVA
jgi:DDE superfamily endonuclease/Helix-turn-helix of DDE superfamily endonuclease